ncbi:MAG: tRNA-(ms[2]io[6]A)-hydroxylase [Schleiferiaceae bacterium]|jgi:tRNA-(ms[2]io[6]A)-hydroxylase|nr:tRNA-(ms[2]io[6]A)-hydroxylase [Schleiferiaceae bacterium]
MFNYTLSELTPSKKEWIDAVLHDFDSFLQDHADCERKASGMAMSLVAKYPDRTEILQDLIHTGIEELEHFKLVYKIMANRGVGLNKKMTKDLYVEGLLKHINGDPTKGLRDRLIIAAIVENRGFERFKVISENVQDEELAKFYKMIYLSEAKHGEMFLRLAENYFDKLEIEQRYNEMVAIETEVINSLAIAPALH